MQGLRLRGRTASSCHLPGPTWWLGRQPRLPPTTFPRSRTATANGRNTSYADELNSQLETGSRAALTKNSSPASEGTTIGLLRVLLGLEVRPLLVPAQWPARCLAGGPAKGRRRRGALSSTRVAAPSAALRSAAPPLPSASSWEPESGNRPRLQPTPYRVRELGTGNVVRIPSAEGRSTECAVWLEEETRN
jgi:hypothetical protein